MGDSDLTFDSVPAHRVDVVEPGMEARPHRISCKIGDNLRFDTADLLAYCFADWDVRVFDAFLVSAAIQFCDHTKARPSRGWGRHFELRVPVHDPTLWSSAAVSEGLHGALGFLTGDRWNIKFVARSKVEPPPGQQQFNLPNNSCVIIPFSDGLDSRAVAGLMERQYPHRVVRVRLGSRSRKAARGSSPAVPFAAVPYSVRFGASRPTETSARSRGFKFALLSGIAAYLTKTSSVVMPESGQGALGPVLIPVGQGYEDYRSHPLFTKKVERLLSALFGHEVHYLYPRLWRTKAETIAEFIRTCPDGKNWAQTRSCWQGQRQVSVSGRWRQCGICAACMLRRMSVHAVGAKEDEDTYVWEELRSARFEDAVATGFRKVKPSGAQYEYAIAGVLHLDHLAGLLDSSANQIPLEKQVFQLSRCLELSESETRERLQKLLARHGQEWKNFVGSLGASSFVAKWVS